MRLLLGIALIVAGLFAFQNCGRMRAISGTDLSTGLSSQDQSSIAEPVNTEMKECQFISPQYLSNVFKTQLGLTQAPAGDVFILDVNSNPTTEQYVKKYAVALGQANIPDAVPDDRVCTPLKMKLGIQIMMEGCSVALQSPATRSRLFPKGTDDLEMLFLTFLGRSPEPQEVEVLKDLVKSISSSKTAEALCSAVLGSIESLDRS